VQLGAQILTELKRLRSGESMGLPVYDKSLEQGQGDRLPVTQWKKVKGPLDWVLFEGWMLGFTKIPEIRMQSDPSLQVVNSLLRTYKDWNVLLDGFVHLIPKDFSYAIQWRVEAEERMKSQGKPGMSREAIRAYIQKFLPAYRTYVPRLIQSPPVSSDRLIQLELSEQRLPLLDSSLHVK
jgi:D-glycerate 3-kinase